MPQINTFQEYTVKNSITNDLQDEKFDLSGPFSFIEYLDYAQILDNSTQNVNNYKNYLTEWDSTNLNTRNTETNTIREQFIILFKDINENYTTVEEKRYLTTIDFNNEENLSIALPFFAKKIKEPRSNIDGNRISKIVKEYLKINCELKDSKRILSQFEKQYKLNLNLKNFNLDEIGIKNKKIIFSTNIGRNLEYYSGLVFEINKNSNNLNLASGGRYDNLMQTLGAKRKIPAIGGAINYDNLLKI